MSALPMRRALTSLLCLLAATTAFAAEKRNITEKDLFNFVWIGDPQVSADGSRIVFVRVSVNEKKEGYDTSLWTVSTAGGEEPHRLTSGTRDNTPRWSPDGKFVTFTRDAEVRRFHRAVGERRQAGAGSALHAADEWRRSVAVHVAAERRGESGVVA